jgi:PEP-CTERM motif
MLCATLFVFLLTAAPVLAEPVRINQVVQTLTSSQGTPDLRINTLVPQDPGTSTKGGAKQSGPRNDSASSQSGINTDAGIPDVAITAEGQKLGVEIVEEGEVEGTICDCGEILVAGGAFPKWPFLFLAAVPLVFINHCDECDDTPNSSPTPTPTPTPPNLPTPTPTPPGVPEPTSVLLFGTGLAAFGAGLRQRYAKAKLAEQIKAQEEE